MAEEYLILDESSGALPLKGKLRWSCRRGMKELEVLLLPFLDHCYDQLSLEDKKAFVTMLSHDDASLFAWFMGHEIPPIPALARCVQEVQYAVANLAAGEAGPYA